ncbi:MAG: ABC transporter substrate-binding protein [Candidatus Competibacterales bacterium]
MSQLSRRAVLKAAALGTAASAIPGLVLSQEPIRIGSLTPNTGGGGPYGPNIARAHRLVVDRVNAAGGVLGRPVQLIQENSETNPEAAVRAARKLVDADGVLGILGTWSSSVTLGIMPLCQDAGVIQMCTSSSADIPRQDAKKLVFNFQALSPIWGEAIGKLALTRGFDTYAIMALNNDFTVSMVDSFVDVVTEGGARMVNEPFYYNGGQASYRGEVSRLTQDDPRAVFIPAYVTDFTAIFKELFRSGYEGQIISVSIATGDKFKEAVGEAANGLLHGFPVPPIDSPAYQYYLEQVGLEDTGNVQHPFGTAGYDQMSTLLLGIESAGTTDTEEVKRHILKISNGPGETVFDAVEGLEMLRAGKTINYTGASSSVEFAPDAGVLQGRDFMLYEVQDGQDVVVERIGA